MQNNFQSPEQREDLRRNINDAFAKFHILHRRDKFLFWSYATSAMFVGFLLAKWIYGP